MQALGSQHRRTSGAHQQHGAFRMLSKRRWTASVRTLRVVLCTRITKSSLLMSWALKWVSITARIGQSRQVSQLGIFAKSSWGTWFCASDFHLNKDTWTPFWDSFCLLQAGRSVCSISFFSPLWVQVKSHLPPCLTVQVSIWFSVYHLYLNYFQFSETFVTFTTGNLSTFIF